MFKAVFMVSGVLFTLSVLIYKLYISKQKDIMKASHYVASMAIFMALYILSGIALAFIVPNITHKALVLLFALSPFIIGKIATYNTEKIYSAIQIICVLISVVFTLCL